MIDGLMKRIDQLGNPTVVGLDPTPEMMPEHLTEEMFGRYGRTPKAMAEMYLAFNRMVLDGIWDLVPAVKPQIAMYESLGIEGLNAYFETIAYAKSKSLSVIGDIKRGDISSTAASYACHIGGVEIGGEWFDPWNEDWVTVNPYLGTDGIQPFIEAANRKNRGIFVLVKTSNPSSGELQDLSLAEQEGNSRWGEKVYERVARLVDHWGSQAMGSQGYSRVGAVVGATYPEQGARLRELMPRTFFLVPGYGAQGASAKDLAGFFDRDGRGCLVNSSRGITGAYQKDKRFSQFHVGEAAREAVLLMKEDLTNVQG
jgi:orotidine-5'-phosphate decarboxylase